MTEPDKHAAEHRPGLRICADPDGAELRGWLAKEEHRG